MRTFQKRVRIWAWYVIKIGLDHQATQDSPATQRNSVCMQRHISQQQEAAC
jgi:hypothetical protein